MSEITNEERREVAERLRDEAQLWHEILPGTYINSGETSMFFQDIMHFVGINGRPEPEKIYNRLADLIDPTPITGETSDGYHTFNELYHHRAVLFSVIVAAFPEKAWKAKKHRDGTMYDGMFIVGIETPDGQATYHYDISPYWDMFRCKEIEFAPEWDGHTPAQAIERIGKLAELIDHPTCRIIKDVETPEHPWGTCSRCSVLVDSRHAISSATKYLPTRFCPNCGAEVVE